MKNSIPLLGFFLIAITFTSCKSEDEKRAEIVTNDYVRFVDSIIHKSDVDALANWPTIDNDFEKKTNELNIEIDKLEDSHDFDAKIDSATAKYEAFKISIILQKLKLQNSTKE
jgi:hypothetical protein